MVIVKKGLWALILASCGFILASCSQIQPAAKKKADKETVVARATEPDTDEPTKTDPKPDDPDNAPDSTVPDVPSPVKKDDPQTPRVDIDPFQPKDPKIPNVKFQPPDLPKSESTEPGQQVVRPLPHPKDGMAEPALDPKLVALTYIGGKGNQWIQDVGFTSDGKIYARSGGGGFTVYYSADGSKVLEVAGDVNQESVGHRGPSPGTRSPGVFRATCPTTKVQLEIGYELVGKNQTQPFLNSSANWKWWGWKSAQMTKGLEASARGVRVHWLHDGRFLAKVFTDGGNSTVAKDPRKLKDDNPSLATAFLRNPAGPGTLYMSGNLKTGMPGLGTFVKGRALAEAIDPWERLYVGLPQEGKGDAFKIGGLAGFSILNVNMTNCTFSSTLGADHIYCMALKDNMLLVGGVIGQTLPPDPKVKPKNLPARMLPIRNAAQPLPGGDEDGFLAIVKLW